MSNWLRNKWMNLMIALHRTEVDLKSGEDDLVLGDGKYQSHKQGMLSHSLINGELTQEVMDLRWRTYKVLDQSEGLVSEIVGYEDDGTPIVKTIDKSELQLEKFKGDPEDDFTPLLIVDNKPLGTGLNETDVTSDDNIKSDEYQTHTRGKRSIFVKREGLQQFEIEKYTKKLVVKELGDDKVLLEFYVSKYHNDDDRRSRLFLSELKKVKEGKKRISSITDIQGVFFVSYKTIGAKNNLEFEFGIESFDKITEFDGNYLIKFKANKITYGDSITEKYKMDELEAKYERKEKK